MCINIFEIPFFYKCVKRNIQTNSKCKKHVDYEENTENISNFIFFKLHKFIQNIQLLPVFCGYILLYGVSKTSVTHGVNLPGIFIPCVKW